MLEDVGLYEIDPVWSGHRGSETVRQWMRSWWKGTRVPPSECPAITQTVDGQGQTRFVVFMDEDGLSCVLADVAEFRTALTVWAIAHGYAEQLIG